MKGLSITAIGLRTIDECLQIYNKLELALDLNYLELAIGSKCSVDLDYDQLPLILHDSCLYDRYQRYKLDPLNPKTWYPYAEFIDSHLVLAVSLHPPLKRTCHQKDLERAVLQMQTVLQIPVFLEIMPSPEYWCSSLSTLLDVPLLLDVSHINIWHRGNLKATQESCLDLLESQSIGAIHLSHNQGRADSHDLIPREIWFNSYLEEWNDKYFLTYESLPTDYKMYERLDKNSKF